MFAILKGGIGNKGIRRGLCDAILIPYSLLLTPFQASRIGSQFPFIGVPWGLVIPSRTYIGDICGRIEIYQLKNGGNLDIEKDCSGERARETFFSVLVDFWD